MSAGKKKAKKAKRKPVPQPRQAQALMGYLLDVKRRLSPQRLMGGKPDQLTLADRQFLCVLLDDISSDVNPCNRFFESVKHRPRESLSTWDAAFTYLATVELGEGTRGKVLLGRIAPAFGLKDSQLERAAQDKNHGYGIKAFLAGMSPEKIRWHLRRVKSA